MTEATATTTTTTAAPNTAAVTDTATTQATSTPNTASPAAIQLQPDFIDWGKSKGYQDADLQRMANDPMGYKMLTSYRETEKHLGALQGATDRVILPKSADDKAGWDAVYAKLGRPQSPDQYKMEIPQGGDSNFGLTAGQWFHEAGLNQQQASVLNQKWNAHVASEMQRQEQELSTRAAEEVTKVMTEWGGNAKLNGELAQRGVGLMAKELGLAPERVEAIKNGDQVVLSAGEFLKLSRALGELGKTTGDTFEGIGAGNRGTGVGMTPEAAKVKLNQLQNDPAFYARLQKGDTAAVEERRKLFEIIGDGKTA